MSGIGEDDDREDDLSPDMPDEKSNDYFGIGDDEPKIKDPNVQDTDDGGAIVTLDDEDEDEDAPDTESDFYENLAETIPETELNRIATQYLELISKDLEARKKRDEQYEEGIRRTGLGKDAPGGASFEGASKVVHPMMTEACVDFASRAMKELMPASGPAKDFIPGEITAAKVKKARRKTAFMNWQLTVQSKGEFRSELEQLLTQTPLGGVQYMKLGWNEPGNRPTFTTVYVDDMLLPFAAGNFYSAQRRTWRRYLTQLDYEQSVRAGVYLDADLIPASMEPDRSLSQKANDKVEGKSETSYNEDGLRTVYEIYALTNIEHDAETGGKDNTTDAAKIGAAPSPYIITIDKTTSKVLSVYRNWDEVDDSREELEWFAEFPFVPWRGAYAIGLPQMIGGLAAGATGALRALLDAAHISNSQTMLKLKGGSRGGQTLNIQPTQVEEIEGGLNVDDIRKLAMPLPFNPPSAVLYQLLGTLVDASKGVVRTTLEDAVDGNANAPVGTTMARLEQGMVVFSAIHARLHNAMGRVLTILHRLNHMYLDDEKIEAELGEELASRKDFDKPTDVVPVSDPNIFSEAQRFAQVQAIAQRSLNNPLYNARKVEERILETLKIPNAKDLLAPVQEPKEQNAVNENVAATMGRPVLAFPEQDHIAHLKTHLSYLLSPTFGMGPLMAPTFLPAIIGHLKEHIAWWYATSVFNLGTEEAGQDLGDMLKMNKTPEEKRAFDRMLAEASVNVVQDGAKVFGALPPVIAKAMEMVQKLQPPPAMDPTQVAAQDVQRRTADDQQRTQIKGQELQIKQAEMQQSAQGNAQRMQIEAAKMQQSAQTEAQKVQLEAAKLQQSAQTAAQKMAMDQAALQQDAQGNAQKMAMDQAALQQQALEAEQREQHEDDRTKLETASRRAMNNEDNLTAVALAEREIESGEKFGVTTGTGINPQP